MMVGNQSSQGKGIVVLPQEVLEKIDRNKDNLSRAEFIGSCLDSLLETEEVPGRAEKQPQYGTVAERGKVEEAVSREEFEEFKRGVKNLQRAFTEMLLDFVVEPVAKASKEEQERLLQRVRELLEEQYEKPDKRRSAARR